MPTARRVLYCLGAPGYQICDRIVIGIALYFYLPPPGRGFEPQVSEEIFFGILTAFGLAMMAGRLFDALADPIVGHLSDRSHSSFGRRRSFLAYGILPTVVVPVLLFWPPGEPGSSLNAFSLGFLLALYFIGFTVYVAPYLALIPELAWDSEDRVRLSTLLALLSFPVMSLYNIAWPAGIDIGRNLGLSAPDAVRGVVLVSAALGLVLCALPIAAVDERRFTHAVPSGLSLMDAVRETLSNRAFLMYLAAQLLFVLSVNLASPSIIYYATVVLGRSEIFAAIIGIPLLVATLVAFPIVIRLTRRFGPKRAMVACTLMIVPALGSLGLLVPDVPGGEYDRWNLAIGGGAIFVIGAAVAGFLVLPHVLISQLVDYDVARTGANRAAMYFGVQGFCTKWMYGIAAALLAFFFSRFGKSPEAALGVLLVGPVAAGAALISAVLWMFYPEQRVLAVAQSEGDASR